MTIDLRRWAPSLTAHAKWLARQSDSAVRLWSRRLRSAKSTEVESAVAEAVTWDFVESRCSSSRLADLPGQGGPDFEFMVNGQPFFVEVTNISLEAATAGCGMPDTALTSGFYGLLTSRIRQKVRSKFKQANQRTLNHPLLVAVTTLHWNASHTCVDRLAVEYAMGSPPCMTCDWNRDTGAAEGDLYESTDLSCSVFLSPTPTSMPNGAEFVQARFEPISGFLLGGFGLDPKNVRVFGALNPEATQPFEPQLLPDVPFCAFREWPVFDSLAFTWTITREQEDERERLSAERRLRNTGHGRLVDDIRSYLRRRELQEAQGAT